MAYQLGDLPDAPHQGPPSARLAYSVREAAQIANLGRSTLYKLIAQGELRARKAYGRTLILHDDLDAFLKGLPSLDQTSGALAQNYLQNELHSEE
jgi:excisionase family DNA binding protein